MINSYTRDYLYDLSDFFLIFLLNSKFILSQNLYFKLISYNRNRLYYSRDFFYFLLNPKFIFIIKSIFKAYFIQYRSSVLFKRFF